MKAIEIGDCIEIHYTTCALEGSVIETSRGREPLKFIVGSDEVLPGLNRGIVGMRPGECKRISISAEQAFGHQHDDLVRTVPRSLLPDKVAVGDQLSVSIDGTLFDVWIQKLSQETAILDANHPLAGESLIVDIEAVPTK